MFLSTLSNLSRSSKKLLLASVDCILLYSALWVSFFIRLEEWWPRELAENWSTFIWAPLISLAAFYYLGLYNTVVRYIAPRFIVTIIKAVTIAVAIFLAINVMAQVERVPRSLYFLYWVTSGLLIGGVRLIAREILPIPLESGSTEKLVAIYGAGAAGTQIAHALRNSCEYTPVAFLDDNAEKQGLEMMGCTVYPPGALSKLINRFRIEEVILTIPSESRARRREIIEYLQQFSIVVKTVPGIPDILAGGIQIDDLRKVEIEDLLGRDPVAPNEALFKSCIADKVVLVSGAGGSIGSELCRQICTQRPSRIVLYELNEYALYSIDRQLRQKFPGLDIVPVLGSVVDRERLDTLLATHRVQTIYHAAAYKHVPMVESNLIEGVKNNIFGTLNLAWAAVDAKVETFILISTDKAVRPTSVMGATKRFAELILQGITRYGSDTRFTMVRFGNVLGSSGSVVPLFREQIRKGGPVTVTHPEMTRYFMTIPEASQLVIQAGAMGKGGDVFVLDMGESVKILELARKMITLSGLTVVNATGEGDIAIDFTGLRPGEKLYEELLIGDNVFPTEHPLIKRAEEVSLSWEEVESLLEEFQTAIDNFDSFAIRELFQRVDMGYRTQSSGVDVATRPPLRVVESLEEEMAVATDIRQAN